MQALAQSDAAQAAALLNTQETPAWRALRSALLQQLETARTAAATANAATQAQAKRMQLLAAALALGAAVAALALTGVMLRTLRRELGGDLAQARSALRRVAEGDLTLGAADQGGPAALGLMADLGRMQASLRQLVAQVRDASGNVTGESVFDSVQNMIDILDPASGVPYTQAAYNQALGGIMDSLDHMNTVRASIGSRLKALDDLKTSAEDVNLNYEMRLSELQDLDWLSAISSFTQHKMQLDAAQTTFQQTSQMSLFSML